MSYDDGYCQGVSSLPCIVLAKDLCWCPSITCCLVMTMGQLAKAVVVHCVGYPLFAVNECCVVDLLVSTVFDADQCRRSMEDQWRKDRLTILWQPEVWCRCTLGLIKYAMHNASSLWVCTRWLSSMKAKFWRSHYSLNTGMEDAVQWNIQCSRSMEH